MANDTLGRRYLFKLLSNMATIPLFFVMEAVLPRALGPSTYGNYNFATNLFRDFTIFLDMGTSTCLSTTLAKRPNEFGLAAFYLRVAFAMLIFCVAAGALAFLPGAGELIMPGVPLWIALPAALWAYSIWIGRVTRSMNDALGITARSELVRIGVSFFSTLSLLALFFSDTLSLPALFAQQYITQALLTAGFLYTLYSAWFVHAAPPSGTGAKISPWPLSPVKIKAYAAEFWHYSSPLFILSLCSALILMGERWILQFFEGSVQQGHFSLSQKIGMACFLFVSAMTPLFMRELATAHAKQDTATMGRLINRYAPILYTLAAWIACFTLVEARAVVRLFGGEQFSQALIPVQIMTLYPIHQCYGQVAGAVFYATGETRLLKNLTLATLAPGFMATWFLLAPASLFGLQMGAAGLAGKMVGTQIVSVNILLFVCRRSIPFHYGRNLLHQLLSPSALIVLALASQKLTLALGLGSLQGLPRFFASGFCYCLFVLLLAVVFPFALGLHRGEALTQARRLVRFFTQKSTR